MQFTSQDSTGRIVQHGDGAPRTHAILIGETLTFSAPAPIKSVELVVNDRMPGGGMPSIDGRTVAEFDRPGRYRFKVIFWDDSYHYADTLACEPSCFSRFDMNGAAYPRGGVLPIDHRRALSSLANGAPWFDGSEKSLHGRSLSEYGV